MRAFSQFRCTVRSDTLRIAAISPNESVVAARVSYFDRFVKLFEEWLNARSRADSSPPASPWMISSGPDRRVKKIIFTIPAQADVRRIDRETAMRILTALHSFAEAGEGQQIGLRSS
jgi:hypothetical protein